MGLLDLVFRRCRRPTVKQWRIEWDDLIRKPPITGPVVSCARDPEPHTFNWHGHEHGGCESPIDPAGMVKEGKRTFLATCVDPKCPDAPRLHEYGPGCPTFRFMWECACGLPEMQHTNPGKPLGCPVFRPKWTFPDPNPTRRVI